MQRHKALHGVGDLISPQTPQNQQLLEGIEVSFPFPGQRLPAKQLGAFWGGMCQILQLPKKRPSCLQAATAVSEGTRTEVIGCSSEAISQQARAASTGEAPNTVVLRQCVSLLWASNMLRQGLPWRRRGNAPSSASCGTALEQCWCCTAKLTKQGTLACEA